MQTTLLGGGRGGGCKAVLCSRQGRNVNLRSRSKQNAWVQLCGARPQRSSAGIRPQQNVAEQCRNENLRGRPQQCNSAEPGTLLARPQRSSAGINLRPQQNFADQCRNVYENLRGRPQQLQFCGARNFAGQAATQFCGYTAATIFRGPNNAATCTRTCGAGRNKAILRSQELCGPGRNEACLAGQAAT